MSIVTLILFYKLGTTAVMDKWMREHNGSIFGCLSMINLF